MSSEAPAQTGAAPAAAPAAAAGGSSMMMIVAIVVVVIVVVAALGYFLVLKDDGDEALEGQWTVSSGEIKIVMVMNNDTANTYYNNETIESDPEVIDFDNPDDMPEGMEFTDLGDGEFEITNYEMEGADFGTIEGTYEIEGDTLTIHFEGSGTYIDGTVYMEIDIDYTVEFARA